VRGRVNLMDTRPYTEAAGVGLIYDAIVKIPHYIVASFFSMLSLISRLL
jgi:hypothetical protein